MSDNQTPTQPASGEGQGTTPRGLIGRRGGAVNPSTRLPSLRPARDLTLGGVQKRAFKPNLNVAGRKDKSQRESFAKEAASSSTPKGRGQRSERGERGGRGRGRGRGRGETIQSHSIFEQGPADRLNKKGGGHYGGGGGDRAAPSSMSKSAKREKMTEEEASRMQHILKDDFVSDPEDEDKKYCPIHLPLVVSSVKKEPKMEPKAEPKAEPEDIKMEEDSNVEKGTQKEGVEVVDMTEEEESKPVVEAKPTPPPMTTSRKALPGQTPCAALFGDRTKSEGELLFFQLPDSLPGQPTAPDDEDPRPKVKREPGTTAPDQAATKTSKEETKPSKCTLQSLPEGFLGKLQVLKSGKTRLNLGNVTLDVAMGTPCGFLQDLMSIRLDDDERSGELVRLGQVKHRVVCTPDFEALLRLEAS